MAKWKSFGKLIVLTVASVAILRSVAEWAMYGIIKGTDNKGLYQVADKIFFTNGNVTDKELTNNIDCPQQRLKFLNETHPNYKKMTLLYSYPGSGNTWLRHLIQEATGFYTGSIYNDINLYRKGFEGEMHHANDGSCIVYKSHTKHTVAEFKKVIILLRNPFHAFKAAFNLEKGVQRPSLKHVAYAHISMFYSNDWKEKVIIHLKKWETRILHYLDTFKGPVHLVLYEDLQRDLIKTMTRLVKFLNLKPHQKHMLCMYHNREGYHHRKFRNGTSISNIYSAEMKILINASIKRISSAVVKKFPTSSYDIIHRYTYIMD